MNERLDGTSEDIVVRGYNYTREHADEMVRQVESYVRENPGQAMVYAFVAGYILNRLPVGGMMRGLLKLSIFGLKPALLLYGASKAYEATQDE
ncbi:MAG: hypothetical protein ABJB69_07805 [Spartobacteria bacterium]